LLGTRATVNAGAAVERPVHLSIAFEMEGPLVRMLMTVSIPTEVANDFIRQGTFGSTLSRILDDAKPEAVYFGTLGSGERSGMIVVDLKDTAEIVKYAEPWFMTFGASVNFEPVMSLQDLQAAAPHLENAAKM
jgi:hypothetical protein